jgi:hypothetical protein
MHMHLAGWVLWIGISYYLNVSAFIWSDFIVQRLYACFIICRIQGGEINYTLHSVVSILSISEFGHLWLDFDAYAYVKNVTSFIQLYIKCFT